MVYEPDVSKKAQYKSMIHIHHLIRKILLSCLLIPGLVSAMTIGQTVELGKLETFTGTSYSLPASNTKNTLVMIWASWCPFCQRQNVYLEKGVLCESNAQLVSRAKRLIGDLGGQIASANEARQMPGL